MILCLFTFCEKSTITSEERMRHLEQLEKRSEKGSTQQAVIIESITSEERMRQLEQLEKRSQKSSAQQIQVVESTLTSDERMRQLERLEKRSQMRSIQQYQDVERTANEFQSTIPGCEKDLSERFSRFLLIKLDHPLF
jgi:hypothetical protein